VTHSTGVGPPHDWAAEPSALRRFFTDTFAIASTEIAKLRRDPTEIITRAVQPALWLVVFGQVFSRTHAIPTGGLSYLEFMAPGVLAQSVLFTAIFYGIAIIWERDLGIVHKLLVSPASRGALVLGKAVSGGVRALAQAIIVVLLTLALGVRLRHDVPSLLGTAAVVVLGGALFSTLSFVIACVVKTRERFMGIGQVITMPLFFASSAIYPISVMPPWLRTVSRYNPLTYLVDALRALMIEGGPAATGLPGDLAVLVSLFVVLTIIGARLYPGIVR